MKAMIAMISSLFVHVSVALAAWHLPQYFQLQKKKAVEPKLYSVELIQVPRDQALTLPSQKPASSKVTKKHLKKPKQKTAQKKWVTQKQKSPVKVKTTDNLAPPLKNKNDVKPTSRPDDSSPLKLISRVSQKSGNRPPQYPWADRLRRKTGRVTLIGFVTQEGRVTEIKVTENTGTQSMLGNAIKAFANYQFEEGQEGWVKMPFEYTLHGEAKVLSVRDRALLNSIQ